MIVTPEAEGNKNIIEAHSMIRLSKSSFAEECKTIFDDDNKING